MMSAASRFVTSSIGCERAERTEPKVLDNIEIKADFSRLLQPIQFAAEHEVAIYNRCQLKRKILNAHESAEA